MIKKKPKFEALELYCRCNEKLKQLKDGPWDVMLKRSLWCCNDLFSHFTPVEGKIWVKRVQIHYKTN